MRNGQHSKSQSAMEYLMTYGWSILIIAIVLAALFSLGVFSNSNLGPRAQANSCRVFRPNGPGTTTNINLEGVCNGELPQYVGEFNGANSKVIISNSITSGVMTWTGWYYFNQLAMTQGAANWLNNMAYQHPANNCIYFYDGDHLNGCTWSPATWYFVAIVVPIGASDANTLIYINGVSYTLSGVGGGAVSSPVSIGYGNCCSVSFNGLIANVQLYSTALDANAIQSLYQEGIGGAPIEPQNLVGWYPLDGDTNDYSGDNVNGAASNLIFTSTWTNGYTTP